MKLGDIKGELETTDFKSENRFMSELFSSGSAVESFDPLAGINSFGDSLNPVSADGCFQPRKVTSVEIENPPYPKLWLQVLV